MIRVTCKIPLCNLMAYYFGSVTLEQIQNCPPFHNIPSLEGEHEHDWEIKEIIDGGKKHGNV